VPRKDKPGAMAPSTHLTVSITVRRAEPTATQEAAWKRLWQRLLAGMETNAPEPRSRGDKEAPDPPKG